LEFNNFLSPLSQSYREFHADLFPETAGSEAPIYASQWMTGTNATVEKILLDPSRWQGKNLHVKNQNCPPFLYFQTRKKLIFLLFFLFYFNFVGVQIIRGPLSERKEEVKVVKTVPTPKPRKTVSDESSLTSNNIMAKVFFPISTISDIFTNI
jgi:coronin-7